MKKILFMLAAICYVQFAVAQNEHAFKMNEKLGKGINIGNGFDAPKPGDWGVVITEDFFVDIAERGFKHVRLPVRWSAHAADEAPYTIDAAFMDTVQWAIDLALENKLSVMLDVHHFEEMFEEPLEYRDKLFGMWAQIAEKFKDYPDSLYFEIMNEPHDKYTADLWNEDLLEALDIIRVKNPTRMVVIGTAEYGGMDGLKKLEIPASDTNLIVTVHYYNPYTFTHQDLDWTDNPLPGGVIWDSTASKVQTMRGELQTIQNYSTTHTVPINIGEYGALSGADSLSRRKWTGALIALMDEFKFSHAYWMYNDVYDATYECYRNFLLEPLTGKRDECDCAQFDDVVVGNPTFENGTYAPWQAWDQSENLAIGTEGELSVVKGEARLEIVKGGTELWHVQMGQTGVPMNFGSTYRFKFDAYASQAQTIMAVVSQNGGEYTTYGEVEAALTTEKQNFSVEFLYEGPTTDNRIVFECGLSEAQYLYFDNIFLEEIAKGTPVESVIVTVSSEAPLTSVDDSVQLTAIVLPENAMTKEVTWRAMNLAPLVTVSETGLVKPTGRGSADIRIRATSIDGEHSGECIVKIDLATGIEDVSQSKITVSGVPYAINGTIKEASVVNILGQITKILVSDSGNDVFVEESQLSEGLNVIKVVTDSGVQTIKIIK